MTPSTIAIPARDLHAAWPFLERGLHSVVAKTHPEWRVEDVYSTLRAGTSQALVSYCDQTPIGFTIFYTADIPWSGRRELFVWVAWTLPPAERPTGLDVNTAIAHNFALLEQIARREGCARIACSSPRPGFEWWVGKFGLTRYLTVYARNL